jgi:major membrane immunogen (membrane-anchored lipoprotein)
MKKITFLLLIAFLTTSCGGTKKTENAITSGNYDQAFDIAVQKLTKDKIKMQNKFLS